MLDEKIINDFRKIINSNSFYILHKHRNQEGKNRWNIICSAMDWITVSISNIKKFTFIDPYKDMNKYCIQVYNYISLIDIINESITQLHRVITDSKCNPFKGLKEIFSNNEEKDDDEYFKHVRAIFGAHPVNLKKDSEKWYASWPTKPHFNDYDIQVFLYPLDNDKEDKTFGIYLHELENFVESRYNYLECLITSINNDFNMYKKNLQNKKIQFLNDELSDMRILLNEHIKRLPNDYIKRMIKDTIKYFGVTLTGESNRGIYESFITKLRKVVDDLKYAIQMLDYDEKESYDLFVHEYPKGHYYAFSKYMEVLGGKFDSLSNIFFKEIKECLKDYVTLKPYMKPNEQKLLIVAALYEYTKTINIAPEPYHK